MRNIYQKRNFKSRFMTLLILLCLISSLFISTMTAYAAGGDVTLTVNQTFVNHGTSTPPGEAFTYRLTPLTSTAPMPIGSTTDGYTFTISGNQERQIGPISFNTLGLFTYELRNVTANADNNFTIDQRVYMIYVQVTEGFEVAIIVKLNDDAKVPEILFENSYHQASSSTPTPTPDSSPSPSPTPTPDSSSRAAPTPISSPNPTATPTPIPGKPGDGPKTGDFSNPVLWIALIAGSIILLLFIIFISLKSIKQSQRNAK